MLTALLNHATLHVPRYKGLDPVLRAFPILNKQLILNELAAHLSVNLAGNNAKLVELLTMNHLPGGGKFDYLHESRIYIEETSGSSGIPFRIPKTKEERTRIAYGIWKCRRNYDSLFTPERFYPFDHAPSHMFSRGNPNDFSKDSVDKLYTNLSSAGIRWIHGRPRTLISHAAAISDEIAKNKSVCFAENTGYTLTKEDRQVIETKLNVAVVDQYGCREVWAVGARSNDGPFETLSENVVVEIVDETGNPIIEPGIEGRIVVTSLHQQLLPFIRYAIGDVGAWEGSPANQRFRLASYRAHNSLQFGDCTINGNEFSRSVLNSAHKTVGYDRIEYIQIRQVARNKFILAVSNSPKSQALCDAVNVCWNVRHPESAHFDLVEIAGAELASANAEKPDLFTTKYMAPNT